MVDGTADEAPREAGSVDEVARWLQLLEADPEALTATQRRAALRALVRLSSRVDACTSRMVGSMQDHGDHLHDGAKAASGWMACTTGVEKRRCRRWVAIDRDLRWLPLIRAAWREGMLTTDAVGALLAVSEHVEVPMKRDQALLIRLLRDKRHEVARAHLRDWRESALAELDRSPDAPEPDDPKQNELRLTESFDGQLQIDGLYGTLVGKELAGLVAGEITRCFQTGEYRNDDGLTVRQRNADALLRLVRRGDRNLTEAGEPKRAVTILVDLNRLLGIRATTVEELLAWRCQTADGTAVPLAQVLDVMGDATINTVLGFYGLDGRFKVAGEVTTARHANASQRRHLRVRDQGCAWPGCDAPATWCQAHHEPPWDHTHHTTTAQLVLLCRHHHALRHREGYAFTLGIDGDLLVSRPDGTPLPSPPPGDLLPPNPPDPPVPIDLDRLRARRRPDLCVRAGPSGEVGWVTYAFGGASSSG